jgi:hypothetical protein
MVAANLARSILRHPIRRCAAVDFRVVTPRRREQFAPVTLGHMRGHGCRDVLIYCESLWCRHSAIMNVDALADETPVRSLCARMLCTRCGLIGADVRPDWSPHTNSKRVG